MLSTALNVAWKKHWWFLYENLSEVFIESWRTFLESSLDISLVCQTAIFNQRCLAWQAGPWVIIFFPCSTWFKPLMPSTTWIFLLSVDPEQLPRMQCMIRTFSFCINGNECACRGCNFVGNVLASLFMWGLLRNKFFPYRVNPVLEGVGFAGKHIGSHRSCLPLTKGLFESKQTYDKNQVEARLQKNRKGTHPKCKEEGSSGQKWVDFLNAGPK